MEEEENMRENEVEERDFEDREGGRVFEERGKERHRWKRGEHKGREDPGYERNGTWSRKVGGERRRETLGGEGRHGESVEGKQRKSLVGDEGSSLSRSASLPPASRERSWVKRVS